MKWMQISLVMTGEIEVLDGTEQPLLMVTPDKSVVVGDPNGKMCLTISSRPWFVPLTEREVLLVRDALATEDASVLRLLSALGVPAFMTTELSASSSESVT